MREFWQCELFFWPGFVPRQVHIYCPLGYGTSWDRLNAGIVTTIGIPDAFSVGDPAWVYIDPGLVWEVQILLHKTAFSPKQYTWGVRVQESGPMVASLAYSEMAGPHYVFGNDPFIAVSTLPPYSLGIVPPIVIRPAVWSEV